MVLRRALDVGLEESRVSSSNLAFISAIGERMITLTDTKYGNLVGNPPMEMLVE